VLKVAAFGLDASVTDNEFVTAYLLCQSLAGQLRPMQTQCTHASRGKHHTVSKLREVLLEQQTAKFLHRNNVY